MRLSLLVLSLVLALSLPAVAGDQPKELVGTWQVVLPELFKTQIAEMERAVEANPDDERAKAMIEGMKKASEMKMEFTADGRVIAHMGPDTDEAKWSAVPAGTNTWTLNTVDAKGISEDVKASIEGDVLTISDDTQDEPLQFTRVTAAPARKAAPGKK